MGAIGSIIKRAAGNEVREEELNELYFTPIPEPRTISSGRKFDFIYRIQSNGAFPIIRIYTDQFYKIREVAYNRDSDFIYDNYFCYSGHKGTIHTVNELREVAMGMINDIITTRLMTEFNKY